MLSAPYQNDGLSPEAYGAASVAALRRVASSSSTVVHGPMCRKHAGVLQEAWFEACRVVDAVQPGQAWSIEEMLGALMSGNLEDAVDSPAGPGSICPDA